MNYSQGETTYIHIHVSKRTTSDEERRKYCKVAIKDEGSLVNKQRRARNGNTEMDIEYRPRWREEISAKRVYRNRRNYITVDILAPYRCEKREHSL